LAECNQVIYATPLRKYKNDFWQSEQNYLKQEKKDGFRYIANHNYYNFVGVILQTE
jgi:hypothetical protein